MENKENKCFICRRPAEKKLPIIVDNGGKLHENVNEEQMDICNIHFKEFEFLKRKKQPKADFH